MRENFYKSQLKVPGKIIRGQEHAADYGVIPRFFLTILSSMLLLSPAFIIKGIADNFGNVARRTSAEIYTLFKVILYISVLLCGLSKGSALLFVAAFFLVDLHLYLFGLIFLRKFWGYVGSIERSLFLMLLNLGELVLAFSIIHLATAGIGSIVDGVEVPITESLDAIYFSVVTITTLGYGDLSPINDCGKIAVIFQVVSAVIFFAIFLGAFIGRYASTIIETKEQQ